MKASSWKALLPFSNPSSPNRSAHQRRPTDSELKNIAYGRAVARHLAQYDIGQTVVIAEAACVAVEAMEGSDAAILRAGKLLAAEGGEALLSRELTVVKWRSRIRICALMCR